MVPLNLFSVLCGIIFSSVPYLQEEYYSRAEPERWYLLQTAGMEYSCSNNVDDNWIPFRTTFWNTDIHLADPLIFYLTTASENHHDYNKNIDILLKFFIDRSLFIEQYLKPVDNTFIKRYGTYIDNNLALADTLLTKSARLGHLNLFEWLLDDESAPNTVDFRHIEQITVELTQ